MTVSLDGQGDALLLAPSVHVTCPKCEHEFTLAEGFAKKSFEVLEEASQGALARIQARAREAEERRAADRAAQHEGLLKDQIKNLETVLEAQRQQNAETVQQVRKIEQEAAAAREQALHTRLKEQDSRLADLNRDREALAARARELASQEAALNDRVEQEATVRATQMVDAEKLVLTDQLQKQADQLFSLQKNELELRKDRANLEARQGQLELEVQRQIDEKRRQIEEAARASEAERSRLREADLQKRLDDATERVTDMQRQLEQGSQQLQGEVLELLLEDDLRAAFPLDSITEVKKGVRGGDAVHAVTTRSGQTAGIILWEAKRAQNWNRQWPAKLKADMREAGAVAGVIVTTSFPADWPDAQPFGLHEDIWLTSSAAAIPMAAVLREGLLEAHKARAANANKGEKMEAVYDYLTSPQFAHKLKAVYDVFGKLREEMNAERTSMLQRWKRREKQIEQAIVQLIGIAGDLQGLAQQDLPQLDLAPAALDAPEPVDEVAEEGP